MKTLPRELTGAGTGIYNLLRNLGASLGISMVTTMLVRGEQAHQDVLVTNLNSGNPPYWNALQRLSRFFAIQGGNASATHLAMGSLYRNLVQQASLCSYIDDFRLLGILSVSCLPFIFFFRNAKLEKKPRRGATRYTATDPGPLQPRLPLSSRNPR
jgi:DHA2 family multidrug resistance protein